MACLVFALLPSPDAALLGPPVRITGFLMEPLCQNTGYKKLAGFEKQEYNYSYFADIIIIPAPNIHCPISPKLLVRFCESVVLFVLNRVFMSSHGRMEVTTG